MDFEGEVIYLIEVPQDNEMILQQIETNEINIIEENIEVEPDTIVLNFETSLTDQTHLDNSIKTPSEETKRAQSRDYSNIIRERTAPNISRGGKTKKLLTKETPEVTFFSKNEILEKKNTKILAKETPEVTFFAKNEILEKKKPKILEIEFENNVALLKFQDVGEQLFQTQKLMVS